MDHPAQITFRHMTASPAVEARIHEEVAALQRFCDRIISCHIRVEEPNHHQQRGRGVCIGITLRVPGSEIIVSHEPSLSSEAASGETARMEKHLETQPEHKDVYVSIRDAFAAARRQLADYIRISRGDIKQHDEAAATV
jgi:ribosome-associated translation inhibitor RaiA